MCQEGLEGAPYIPSRHCVCSCFICTCQFAVKSLREASALVRICTQYADLWGYPGVLFPETGRNKKKHTLSAGFGSIIPRCELG